MASIHATVATKPATVVTKFRLPLTLRVVRIARMSTSIEIEASIFDAEGTSVESAPITVGNRSAAEVASILQNHVDGVARSLHRRSMATLAARATEAETDADFEALAKREFVGSVST